MAYLSKIGNHRNFGLLFIRVGLGAMFIYHGYPKLLAGPEGWASLGASTQYIGITFLPVMWGLLAAATETIGGLLIILGLLYRPACVLLVLTLAVAIASHFGKGDNIEGAAHAIEDAIIFTGLFFVGPGSYSLDKK